MNKKDLRILFMGTPEIAANTLEELIQDGFYFCGVVAQTDKPTGRNGKIIKVPTKVVAEKYNIPVFQPLKIRRDYSFILTLKPDLILTLAYGQIVPLEVLNTPKYGALNLHGSILPKYRGASPIQAALIHGDTKSGVSLMEMTKDMDAGKVYAIKEVNIDDDDNATSLFKKIQVAASELAKENILKYVNGELVGMAQDENKVSYCHLIKKEDEKLNLDMPKEIILGWIRALSNEPGAYLFLDSFKIKIFKARIKSDKMLGQIGEIIQSDKNGLIMQCKNGLLELLEVQKEGKKRMDFKAFINGNQNLKGKRFI